MKKYILLLNLLFSLSGFAQNFPYLNASTGNPDFFTDADTNMYLVHSNRLAKLDKNFNADWVNTYGNLVLRRILLSKTGSMYFVAASSNTAAAATIVGKINPNGSLSWARSTASMTISASGSTLTSATLNCSGLFLSSDNNLLLSGMFSGPGNAAILKLDTMGNFIMSRSFMLSNFINNGSLRFVNILNESSGLINVV